MVNKLIANGQKILQVKQNNILSAALVITVASLLSAVLGFIRERILISYFFESNPAGLDAFRIASRLPELTFQLLVIGALSAAFIPIFGKYLQKDKAQAYLISSGIINLVLLAFTILSAVIFWQAENFTDLITGHQFTPEQITLAAQLTRVMVFAQFFFALSNFLTGMIQSHQRFLIPALAPLAHNLGIIAGIIIFTPTFGIFSPAIGIVIGSFLHLMFQLPLALKLGFTYRFTLGLHHPGVREMLRLMPPRAAAISVNQLEYFATGYFATAMSAGSLTLLEIAQRLMTAPIRIFAVPIGQASLPFLTKEAGAQDKQQFKDLVIHSLTKIMYLTLPAAVLLIVLRVPLVRILYGAKTFPWAATLLTGKAVAILSLAIFAHSAQHIITRAFYAMENTKTPLKLAALAMTITITLSAITTYVFDWGIIGLAAALSTSAICHFICGFAVLHRHVGGFRIKSLTTPLVKMTVASALMGLFLWGPMRLLDQFVFDTTRTVPLIALTLTVSLIGSAVYLLLSKFLYIQELGEFQSLLNKLGNWRKVLDSSDEVIETASPSDEVKPS